MPRLSKSQRAKNLLNEGKTELEVSKETGLFISKIHELKEEISGLQSNPDCRNVKHSAMALPVDEKVKAADVKMSDLKVGLTSSLEPEKIELSKPSSTSNVTGQPKQAQIFTIDQYGGTAPSPDESKDLREFRAYLAQNVATFEAALFKAITDEKMEREEKEMLQESWHGLFRILIKDRNMEIYIAILLLGTAHGTVYLMNKEKINAGVARIRQRKVTGTAGQTDLSKDVSSPSSPSPVLPPKHSAMKSSVSSVLLGGDSLR